MQRTGPAHTVALLIGVLTCMHAAFGQAPDTDAIALTSDTAEATAGYFQLRWNSAAPVRLVESTSIDFRDSRIAYEGRDNGHTVSGRADGELFYRLESPDTGAILSEPVRVVVAHHPRSRAFAFFGLGAAVFVATAALIVVGSRRSGP